MKIYIKDIFKYVLGFWKPLGCLVILADFSTEFNLSRVPRNQSQIIHFLQIIALQFQQKKSVCGRHDQSSNPSADANFTSIKCSANSRFDISTIKYRAFQKEVLNALEFFQSIEFPGNILMFRENWGQHGCFAYNLRKKTLYFVVLICFCSYF